ncbi:hypothetical protein DSM106972_064100 [Dulcicalothrix desertica PCC 7102]|uniref:DUF11 domain-containing protein n=1 Tax=Dulcicalothrix desertica PCC 7102 TaxID=232991 RepID=A0A3S1CHR4_9CYAN|nr:DUF11 domain-containing protein [Dulcicalothrix desertica]RUT01787.1 hypothetical protein DSM106972_064100 [Dulcicalothrix desertica PCC 7102]TWH42939.1 putative repeat protein (TIGR01451 family) [Dulcicalothrix desertica PCC 7102]
MKHSYLLGLAAVTLIASVPVVAQIPAAKNFFQSSANAQNVQKQQKVKLQLDAEKQVIFQNQQGKQMKSWQALKGQASVQPGDVLRYTVSGENLSNKPVKNLTINQPIPQRMEFVLKSAIGDIRSDTKITYSIDGGRSFVENPTVKVTLPNGKVETKAAPASTYTHIRMQIPSVEAKSVVKGSYQVKVK